MTPAAARSCAGSPGRCAGQAAAASGPGAAGGRRNPSPRPSLDRYSRQLVLPEWSEARPDRPARGGVLVVGAGALGSPVATYLAGAGVGRLGIADDDEVEVSNLHRQHLHFTPDVGVPKAPAPPPSSAS